MELDLGYKVNVAAIPIEIFSKFPLSPFSNFFLIPKLKEHLKEVRFNSTDEAKHAAKTWLRNQSAELFKCAINGWKHRLGKCIDRDGGYVEK